MLIDDMVVVVKAEVGENIVQNSVLPSGQLVRSVGTQFHHWSEVCHHAIPTKHLKPRDQEQCMAKYHV